MDGTSPGPILERLTALYPKAIDLSLDRIRILMADLGNPQDRLAPVIHVAGTNGKGSTVAYLRAAFEAAGYRAHVYTSPHLVRFNERIRLAGSLIEDAELAPLLAEVERVNAGRPITFFEVTTAAAFLAFARHRADIVVLETGLGGRLDATNLVGRPAAAIVTSISLDHMDHLGGTLASIAGEKAGILKAGAIAVLAPQPEAAAEILARRAAEVGAPLFRHGSDWRIEIAGEGFLYDGRRRFALPLPALPGRHQVDNAATAVAAIDALGRFAIGEAELSQALRRVEWPARLQRLRRGPLVDLLPAGFELFLDGGHNEGAGQVMADWARSLGDGKPLDLVFAMLSTKQPDAFLAPLAPHVRRLRAVAMADEGAAWPEAALAEAGRRVGIADVATTADAGTAVADLARRSAGPARLLICGSLRLAGKVLADNG